VPDNSVEPFGIGAFRYRAQIRALRNKIPPEGNTAKAIAGGSILLQVVTNENNSQGRLNQIITDVHGGNFFQRFPPGLVFETRMSRWICRLTSMAVRI